MIKKTTALLAPVVTVAMLALLPGAATADKVTKCPKGTTDKHYCKEIKVCHVPKLEDKRLDDAKRLLRGHDCEVGDITRQETARRHNPRAQKRDDAIEHRYEGGVVLKSDPKAGGTYHQGKKVDLLVEV